MKINNKKIIEERKNRSWSQQQLADVANLSLRTVQRIENTGHASYGSTQAVVESLSLDSKTLSMRSANRKNKLLITILSALSGLLLYSLASAKPVMLDINIVSGDKNLAQVHLLNKAGEESEVRIDNLIKVIFKAEIIKENKLRISVQAYEFSSGAGYRLMGSPIIISNNKQMSGVKFDSSSGSGYQISITPDYSVTP